MQQHSLIIYFKFILLFYVVYLIFASRISDFMVVNNMLLVLIPSLLPFVFCG